ncbi:MAG: iron ABC transporter permease [Bacteroidales bacterium]|nr:iron ABC transporter permease [Bacteroidales bacterium]
MRNKTVILSASIIALLSAVFVALTSGENGCTVSELLSADTYDPASTQYKILTHIRLPRILMAVSVGGLLAFSGLIMQNIFRNPLVEPYTMGLSGGAVVGVALMFISGLAYTVGSAAITAGALIGALATMVIILALYRTMLRDTTKMLLSGIMISIATSALTTLIMSFCTHENLSQIIAWTMGSFDNASLGQAMLMTIVAAMAMAASMFMGNILNIISLGEQQAQHVGLNVRRAVPILFTIATLIAAASVAAAGIIAFTGMIIPHVARIVVGYDNRVVGPLSVILGATFMILCDTIAHNIVYPRELPVGVISGILGSVLFIYLALRKK